MAYADALKDPEDEVRRDTVPSWTGQQLSPSSQRTIRRPELIRSSYADTVQQLLGMSSAGGPPSFGPLRERPTGTEAGSYSAAEDRIGLLDWYPSRKGQKVMAHEAGHREQEVSGLHDAQPHHRSAMDSAWQRLQSKDRLPAGVAYAASNPEEHYAETYARAMQLIRSLPKRVREYRQNFPERSDQEIVKTVVDMEDDRLPGVREQVSHLLQQEPILEDHPAQDMLDHLTEDPEPLQVDPGRATTRDVTLVTGD